MGDVFKVVLVIESEDRADPSDILAGVQNARADIIACVEAEVQTDVDVDEDLISVETTRTQISTSNGTTWTCGTILKR